MMGEGDEPRDADLIGVRTPMLNRSLSPSQIERFEAASNTASQVIANKASGSDVIGDPRSAVELYVSRHAIDEGTYPSLAILVRTVSDEFREYGSIGRMPPSLVAEIRNDMYLAPESLRLLMRDRSSDLSADDIAKLRDYQARSTGRRSSSALGQNHHRQSCSAAAR
jgi:PiT family inorganic phosphate transporter